MLPWVLPGQPTSNPRKIRIQFDSHSSQFRCSTQNHRLMFEIKVPEFGESIQEVQVAAWLKKPGDWIDLDEDLVELETEKASQSLSCETAGVLEEIKVAAGEFAKVGDVLCIVKAGQKPAATSGGGSAAAAVGGSSTAVVDPPAETGAPSNWIMPAAERVLSE